MDLFDIMDYALTVENSHEFGKRGGDITMLAELDDEDLKNAMKKEDYTLTAISSMKVDNKVKVSLSPAP